LTDKLSEHSKHRCWNTTPHSGRRPHRDPSSDGLHQGHLVLPHPPCPFTAIVGGPQRHGAPYPRFILLLYFFFFGQRSGLCRLAVSSSVHRRHSRGQDYRCVFLGCSTNARNQAITAGVATFSGATHAAGPLCHAGSWSKSAPIAATSQTPPSMLLKEDVFAQSVYSPAELIGKKLVILCTRVPSLMLRTRALLHGFDHVHLDLGYFGLRGYHLQELLAGLHSSQSIRTGVPIAGDVSIVLQSDWVATATTAGILECIW